MARLTDKVALIVGGGADGPAKAGDKLSIGQRPRDRDNVRARRRIRDGRRSLA
ncbi:MAG: hypothetical protein WCD12_09355 [Candidatus Binatus sp.]|uniref:hypothetical protein n=1 Tax=Candidatus Binatus sp. TaxID=2811406 RepID=UPI003C74DB1A